jgi:hypothetical protein
MGSKSAIGIGNGICFKQVRDKGGGSYIDPLVRDSLVGVWIADQNTNESPTRNIIKNTIKDKGGDLELLNFGYKLNSGYGGYIEDFSLFTLSNRFEYSEISNTKVTITAVLDNSTGIYHSVTEENSALYWNTFKIKVSGSTDDVYISYITAKKNIRLYNGINTVVVPNELSWHSFSASATNVSCNITLEFVPEYEGALVTDGKDDMIVSQKTVQEMLGGSNVCTVVSMIHQINLSADVNTSINNIRSESVAHVCARHLNTAYGKTGIFGYSKQLNTTSNPTLINNILGDKKDYIADGNSVIDTTDKYFVQGYKYNDSLYELSEVAVYWTFISNKVLTTDEINQIIAYFKLDKYVTPQVIYDVKRQGLTNDTPDADWYLKDFSRNGHDMQLYNYAKKLSSGIGKYEVDFNTWIPQSYVADSTYTSNKLHITNIKGGNAILYTKKGANAMKVKITGIQSFNLVYRYIAENDVWEALEVDRDGIYELPASTTTTKTYYTGFTVPYYTGDCDITIEQIPDYEGALVSDGIDDYGKVENLPIYKDYTVVADREIIDGLAENADGGVALKGESTIANSFIFDFNNEVYSFAKGNSKTVDTERFISYQSKYVNNGVNIDVGTGDDTDVLYLAKLGKSDRYSKLAFWSFLLFPYTLSEFLLERQLKRYKLGTLYPDMIEWRPIAKSNIPYKQIDYFIKRSGAYVRLNPGDYFQSTEDIIVRVTPIRNWQLDVVSSIKVNGKNEVISVNSSYAQTAPIHIDKSPQKIDITIDEYIRYEDIVRPYPAIINLKQDGKTITWGDKLKVGSEVTFVNHTNLLPDLYNVSGGVQYNGTYISWNISIRVEKSMVFVNPHIYKKANEPNCILSPNRLRIPNSSYKILGYIPDLTGKGNHGVINNSAYVGMSGANGYVYNWNTWRISKSGITSTITDNSIHITSLKGQYNPNHALFEANTVANTGDKSNFKVNITGLTSDMKCTFNNAGSIMKELINGVNEISVDLVAGWYGFMITTLDGSVIGDCDITIQQIGQYEGSFCLDGVDDYITIPTLAHGGKQVLMKVNLQSYDRYLYDQRNSWSQYLAIVSASKTIAYEYSNKGGKTYIDGILNEHIIDKDLLNITHNITATNANIGVQYAPNIGTSFARGNFAQMALFDFMLFPEISSEEEIKELNDIVGIEGGYVESPDYYFDSFGKSNVLDDDIDNGIKNIADSRKLLFDKSITGLTAIEQTNADGAVGRIMDRALQAYNFAYNEESGYVDNGLVSDGVDDNLKNTNMPVLTDYTWIMKRKRLNDKSSTTLCHKGNGSNTNAFLFEIIENTTKVRSFGIDSTVVFPDLISWQTKNSYNGQTITSGTSIDGNALHVFMGSNVYPYYTKAVFYKAMLYSKTIDQLSINMLKNMFERDELIDVTNPIFKKKEL